MLRKKKRKGKNSEIEFFFGGGGKVGQGADRKKISSVIINDCAKQNEKFLLPCFLFF